MGGFLTGMTGVGSKRGEARLIGLLVVVVFIILLCIGFGVTDEATAARILESEGITDVRFTGYDAFACSEGDWYHTGFEGIRNGKPVSGVVCSGLLLKASTVRYH